MIQGTLLYLSYSHLFLCCISLSHLPLAGRSAPASQSQTGPKQNNAVHREIWIQYLSLFSLLFVAVVKKQPIPPKNKTASTAEPELMHFESFLSQQRVFISELKSQKNVLLGVLSNWTLDFNARYQTFFWHFLHPY